MKTNNLQLVVNIEYFDGACLSVVFLCHLVHQVMTPITIKNNYVLVCFLLNKDRKSCFYPETDVLNIGGNFFLKLNLLIYFSYVTQLESIQ